MFDPMLQSKDDFGLYIHIPYCSFLCHYCDFAKTANWDQEVTSKYFSKLKCHLESWLQGVGGLYLPQQFSSLFFGGGTPGLFTDELNEIVGIVKPFLIDDAEISLEANPQNLTACSLKSWRQAGFNRLSVGVQSFQQSGLNFLKRDHNAVEAMDAIKLARDYFPSINLDLIYGWPNQTLEMWQDDLDIALQLETDHLSLYNLIYESSTPIGRAVARQKIQPQDEELQTVYYEYACRHLAEKGFIHDEVSNWAKPGHSCRHNWLYWTAHHYLGLGAGAHGFLPFKSIGLRYSCGKNDRLFQRINPVDWSLSLEDCISNSGLQIDNQRTLESWLFEYVGCGLRCRKGIDLNLILEKTNCDFRPTNFVRQAIGEKLLIYDALTQIMHLSPKEWLRETAWSFELLKCFEHSNL